MKEERQDKRREERGDKRRERRQDERQEKKNVSNHNPPDGISSKCFEKILFGRIFRSKVQNLTVFSIIHMIRIRFIGPRELIKRYFSAAQYQGADSDTEQLALTEQLFDAAFGELVVVARGQPCLLAGDFNVEPTKIPCLAKRISAGLWVVLEDSWTLAAGLQPSPTCKRTWDSAGGHRRDFMVGCPLAAAAVLSCRVHPGRWVAPHLAVRTHFDCFGWSCRVYSAGSAYSPLACFLVACCW